MSEQEQPSRYNRSARGLVLSLLVTVVGVVVLLGLMGLFRHDYEDEPENLPYLDQAAALQLNGFPAIYPRQLTDGWIMRNVAFTPGRRPQWQLAILTDDERFVGMYQARASANDLLTEHVDENPKRGAEVAIDSDVAPRWREWSDDGGDHAYVAKVGDYTVMVYGSAPVEDLRRVVAALTDAAPDVTPALAATPSS